MFYLVWLLSLIAAFWLGYFLRDLTKKVELVQEILKEKVDKKPQENPGSTLVDPLDPVKEAQFEHEAMMRKLNPNE